MKRLTYKSFMGDYGLNDKYSDYEIWNKLGMYEDLEENGCILSQPTEKSNEVISLIEHIDERVKYLDGKAYDARLKDDPNRVINLEGKKAELLLIKNKIKELLGSTRNVYPDR